MNFLISMMILISCSHVFAREGYEASRVVMDNLGQVCIFEELKKDMGSLINCSSDHLEGAPVKELDQRIKTFLKNKPLSLLQNFLDSRPLARNGSYDFKIKDFVGFLDSIDKSPSCQTGLSNYNSRKTKLENQFKELQKEVESNEMALRGSCQIPRTQGNSKEAPAQR